MGPSEVAADAASYAMGQCEAIDRFCSCICNGQCECIGSRCHFICHGPTQRHWQLLQLRMEWTSAKASAAAAAVYAKGQCKCIGRCCICVCNGPTQRHRQQQLLHM